MKLVAIEATAKTPDLMSATEHEVWRAHAVIVHLQARLIQSQPLESRDNLGLLGWA